jgi:hypothetical protein
MEDTWLDGMDVAITVCDADACIVAMNAKSRRTFAADGGGALLGRDLLACHNERSRGIIAGLLASGGTNAYTIEKGGARKLIYQTAWTKDGKVAGLVELSLPLPAELPHFVRE